MLFQNESASLELRVTAYEFPPDAGDREDRNWLVLRCTWTDEEGTIRKDSNPCLTTHELQELTAGLKVLNAGIRDAYESDFLAAGLSLNARPAGEDFQVDVSFLLPNTMDGDDTAELTCPMTKAELKALVDELDGLCKKFPERP